MIQSTNNKLRLSNVACLAMVSMFACGLMGCRAFTYDDQSPNLMGNAPVPNPLIVSMMDRWLVMEQVSDELDNYFKIKSEQRIRIDQGIMSEGRIETHPILGATLLEPWRRDSTPAFERLHATLQTVRRYAKVRVIPTGSSYQIDVKVIKELEDMNQPMGATVRGTLRFDSALDIDKTDPLPTAENDGWIPMGRDFSLEQKILRNIQNRLDKVCDNSVEIDY